MPRVRMPDGSMLEVPYDLPREQQEQFVRDKVREWKSQRTKPAPGFHPGVGSMPFPRDVGEAAEIGDVNRAQSAAASMLTPVGRAVGGAAIRAATHPVTGAALGAGYGLARGHSLPSIAAETAFGFGVGRIPRVLSRLRKLKSFRSLLGLSEGAGGAGRAAKVAEEAIDVPGRTLTKPSAPPFMPKGKMRLDLGPREQTTMTGTVETARPLTPKPQFSSTGAVPRGKVTQPNVRVRAEGSMDPAKQGPATASGPVTPRSTPAGGGSPPARGDFGEYEERVVRIVRDTNRSKQSIIDMFRKETGATPEQARTVIDAIFGKRGLSRQ